MYNIDIRNEQMFISDIDVVHRIPEIKITYKKYKSKSIWIGETLIFQTSNDQKTVS